ncbi:MAG: DUF2269 family protein [Desulfovibrio sp.]|jgi:hypothetical protein|nr:DUF2269 family protein [Desulfovibrio sp.]
MRKKFGAQGQKVLKIIHLCMAGVWLGGAVALFLMILLLDTGESGDQVHAYDLAREFVDDFILVPGAMGCLLSGLLISWATPWGFFKHRWVAVKWLLTVAGILYGPFVLGPPLYSQAPISGAQGLSALVNPEYMANRLWNVAGGAMQLFLLCFMVAVSVIKPWKSRKNS